MLSNIKYIIREKKMIIIVISIILICSIAIAIGIYAQITDAKIVKTEETETKYEELKSNFNNIFTNSLNKDKQNTDNNINYDEIIYCAHDIKENKAGKYDMLIKIPLFKLETDTTKKINQEIMNTFATKALEIAQTGTKYTIYNIDYVAYINNDILSLVIRCTLKDGSNPQRIIIQTYNYDIVNDKILTIDDIIKNKNINKKKLQNSINEEINEKSSQTDTINIEGYNVYKRNLSDKMYKIENVNNFFLGNNNYLYIIYAYGNNTHTSEMDIIIHR